MIAAPITAAIDKIGMQQPRHPQPERYIPLGGGGGGGLCPLLGGGPPIGPLPPIGGGPPIGPLPIGIKTTPFK